MAYDGLWIKSQVLFYQKNLIGKKISKITQQNVREYDFHIHHNREDYILTLSCNPNFPYILFFNHQKDSFSTPPSFCMLLRKYIQGGEFINIKQINGKNNNETLERIVDFSIKNLSPNGEIKIYHIIIELMGKYSNILLLDNNYIIIDLVNKIENSNNRNLLSNQKYETITISSKKELLNIDFETFYKYIYNTYSIYQINNNKIDLANIIVDTFLGISKNYINQKLLNQNIDIHNKLSLKNLYDEIENDINNIEKNDCFYLYYSLEKLKDFHNIFYSSYDLYQKFISTEECLYNFITKKSNINNESYDKTNLKQNVDNIINKIIKKIEINEKDLSKCENMENYKIYGDLISAYGYDKNNIINNNLVCNNFYDNNKQINIPIDNNISIENNIKKYYEKYKKLKRTKETVTLIYEENKKRLEHILSIKTSLDMCNEKIDINNIKYELDLYFKNNNYDNIITSNKKHTQTQKDDKKIKNSNIILHHYITTNGLDVYIGKNNIQNEYLTFKTAKKNDTWFHVKNATGSHVILKSEYENTDMKDIEDAASLAAYFSSKSKENKVEVDYTYVKELKKVKGKMPGFCIYHTNYSIVVNPKLLKEIK